ncbi:MAG TPA: MFS transporter [Mycobacteriales bacterium]|nr:MFS transporter [Mycobacteriales bacterium]
MGRSVAGPGLRRPVLLAYAAFVLIGVTAGVGGVLLPAQIRDYGVSRATIGIMFFTFSAGFMLAGAGAGGVIHRFGMRAALAGGGGAFLVASLYSAARPPFAALVAVQVLAGGGIGMLESALNAYLSGLPAAASRLNRLHAFFGVGALVGPALAAWLLRSLPWTAVWLLLAAACVPLVGGFLLAYPAHPGPDRGDAADPGREQAGPPAPAGGLFGPAVRQPAVWLAALFLAVYVGLEISVGNWGYTFLVEEYQQPAVLAGYSISGYWLGLTAGRFLISPVAARFRVPAAGTSFGCMAGVTASTTLIWLAPAAAVASAGFVLLGFFLGPLFPTAMALVPQLTAARLVPTAIGLINGVSLLGGAVFPWSAGAITQRAGIWTLLPFTLTLAVLQTGIWWRLTRRIVPAPTVRLPSG